MRAKTQSQIWLAKELLHQAIKDGGTDAATLAPLIEQLKVLVLPDWKPMAVVPKHYDSLQASLAIANAEAVSRPDKVKELQDEYSAHPPGDEGCSQA